MAGSIAGGKAAAKTNKRKYGADFYKKIGAKGGQLGTTGGFASAIIGADGLTGRERAKVVGVKGGRTSKRN